MQSVVETGIYLADAKSVGLSEKERAAIVDFVAVNPDAGDEIKGTGGARKIRFGGRGKGKSGGFRDELKATLAALAAAYRGEK